jgi:hypothetical protein
VHERFRGEVKRLQKDPSPRVRAAALHVEQDACLIEELDARLDLAFDDDQVARAGLAEQDDGRWQLSVRVPPEKSVQYG